MVIIETSIFTKRIAALLNDEVYRALQNHLVDMPGSGEIIQGGGGIRKIRWGASGRGKRGGARIIYFWQHAAAKSLCSMPMQRTSEMI